MSYTVLARKYRPQTFADLVGQEHVTRTLSNAIETGRVAHAFLFTGVRGVGKTTSARILAKALNCERGPTPEPCNECDACKQITAGVDLDVLEIDGASNNGVDDVRRLQESLPYRPTRDRYKIVIVDEVHMLSTGAFNAFLKTLEEPPAHVKFIFATTESHKVPVTIRSRCQRYDFRLIPQSVISARVATILAAENIEADAQALAIVSREAAGSMRDALTLLDQVVAFSGDKLFGHEVTQKLGIADREHLFHMAEAVLAGDAKLALEVIDAIASQGLDFGHFTRQWLDLLRDMTVLRVAADRPELVDLPDDERTRARTIAAAHELLELERVFAGVAKLIDEVSKSSSPRLLLEMGAVRLATRPPLRDLSELIARLQQLESAPSNTSSSSPGQPSGARAPMRPQSSDAGARGHADHTSQARSATPQRDSAAPPKANPFQRFVPPESSAAPVTEGHASPLSGNAAPQLAQVTPIASARSAAVQAAPAVHALVEAKPLPIDALPTLSAPFKPEPQLVPPPVAVSTGRPAHKLDGALLAQWTAIVGELRKRDPRWSAMFEHGIPQELTRERVIVAFAEGSFFGRQAQTQGGLDALGRAAKAALQAEPEIQVRFAVDLQGVSLAQLEAAEVDERKDAIKRKALGHPRVIEALKIFPELAQKHDVQVD
jgi:DNA polymerase III subunit gamma/tau